jgi:hypothetical protein
MVAQPSRRHVATGITAVVESAHHVEGGRFDDVWVDADDLADAVETAEKLAGGHGVEVCPSGSNGNFAIRLR